MSKGGRIKSKVVQSTIQNKDVLDMFHGVLGTGEGADLNIKIVYPKYQKVVEHCNRFMCLLEVLRDSATIGRFPMEASHLAGYISALREQEAATFRAPDLAALHPPDPIERASGSLVNYRAVTREEYDSFMAVYQPLKESNLVKTIIVTCNNLIPHKKSLNDSKALKDRFLMRTAGLSFAPLPGLPAMNFKQIYISDQLSLTDRKFILMVLHKMLTISHDVYDTMSSPDIDVDEFVQVIMSSLDDVKKHIPRCDEAFDKIADSVSLLKGNFGGYYKDFIASNNPTIIMEHFVLDVSKSTKNSTRVATQFRRIISHYRKIASQQANHPKLRALFQQVDKNFQELEKRSQAGDGDTESGDDTGSTEAPTVEEETVEEETVEEETVEEETVEEETVEDETVEEETTATRKKRERNRKKRERRNHRKIEHRLEQQLEQRLEQQLEQQLKDGMTTCGVVKSDGVNLVDELDGIVGIADDSRSPPPELKATSNTD